MFITEMKIPQESVGVQMYTRQNVTISLKYQTECITSSDCEG